MVPAAYDANGDKIGSAECEEGKIFIEPQGFLPLSGVGIEEGIAEQALKSTEKLLDTKYGITILQPPYTHYHLNLGKFPLIRRDIRKCWYLLPQQSLDLYRLRHALVWKPRV